MGWLRGGVSALQTDNSWLRGGAVLLRCCVASLRGNDVWLRGGSVLLRGEALFLRGRFVGFWGDAHLLRGGLFFLRGGGVGVCTFSISIPVNPNSETRPTKPEPCSAFVECPAKDAKGAKESGGLGSEILSPNREPAIFTGSLFPFADFALFAGHLPGPKGIVPAKHAKHTKGERVEAWPDGKNLSEPEVMEDLCLSRPFACFAGTPSEFGVKVPGGGCRHICQRQ